MGGAKQQEIEFWENGLGAMKVTFICTKHINDYAIKDFIKSNLIGGKCNYCKGRVASKKVIPFQEFMFFVMKGIMRFYKDAAEFAQPSKGGGYNARIYDPYDLVEDAFGGQIKCDKLIEDIIFCISSDRAWADPSEYWENEAEIFDYQWKDFKKVVMHKSRFFFGNSKHFKSIYFNERTYDVLKKIDLTVRNCKLRRRISINQELFRCRQHKLKYDVQNETDIVSPPESCASFSNRMSPAGISMFYCAFDQLTALSETVDPKNTKLKWITASAFKAKRSLNVIDFSKLPNPPSMFDEKNFSKYYEIRLLWDFVKDISKEIKRDGREHIEYVPTQIVTEYFRYAFRSKNKIDGIIYPSAKNKGTKSCVLFFDHGDSLKNLELVPKSIVRRKI